MRTLNHIEKNSVAGGNVGLALVTVAVGGGGGAITGSLFAISIPAMICAMLNHTQEDCGYAFRSDPKNDELGAFFMASGAILGAAIGISAVGSLFSLAK